MKEFTGRTAVITGAASGLGLAFAHRFGAEGVQLVVADVENEALERAASDLRAKGYDVRAVISDVSSAEQVRALADRAVDEFGRVHLLFNNAGVVAHHDAWGGALEDWEWVIGVDLWGVIHGVRAFVPHMLEHGEPAHVVNTASVAGLLAFPGMSSYNVAKHGVVALSQSMRNELRDANVGVSVLCPGLVRTRILESHRNRPAGLAAPAAPIPAADRPEPTETLAPEDVADLVLDAVRADRFWILPHPRYGELALDNARSRIDGGEPLLPTVE
jgi:NAD(P)-dependent dehydrogenase (short-subunit alcohol dehydrogenase family)